MPSLCGDAGVEITCEEDHKNELAYVYGRFLPIFDN
jgi:hypothetical protein